MKLFGTVTILAGLMTLSAAAFCFTNDGNAVQSNHEVMTPTEGVVSAPVSQSDRAAANDAILPAHPQFVAIEDPSEFQLGRAFDDGHATVVDRFVVPAAYQVPCDGGGNGGCGNCQICQGAKMLEGVDGNCCRNGREPAWRDQRPIPWESFAYGEYIGPYRTPHVGEYRIRINDQLEFVYMLTRAKSVEPYRMFVGDVIQISSAIDASLNQTNITILSDGTISLNLIGQVNAFGKTVEDLQNELNEKYSAYVKNPAIVLSVLRGDTPLEDLRDAVDARAGQGGQNQQALVSPDGTIQLPLIGSIPAIGLTLDEIRREVNARYHAKVQGIQVTPILTQRAPRFVFVVGEVRIPGRYELTGPTTVMQSLALAEGTFPGGNVRQAIVFRRDQNWKLVATRLDLSGALYGRSPHPSDDLWLRDSDIVLIPKKPILRFAEAVDLYFTRSLYGIFPRQTVNFDGFTVL